MGRVIWGVLVSCHAIAAYGAKRPPPEFPELPKEKRARLQQLRSQLPYMSHHALTAVCKLAQKIRFPRINRCDIGTARDEHVQLETPYGRIHQTIDVGPNKLEVQHPFAMLYHTVRSSQTLSDLIQHLINTMGCDAANHGE